MDRPRIDTGPPTKPPAHPPRLYLPGTAPGGGLGDAVGVSEAHGRRIMTSLPRAGAVFAAGRRWWWVVPCESQIGLTWPSTARYWAGACRPGPARKDRTACLSRSAPRLIHWPDDDAAPYTHPLLLYIAVCRLAGVTPALSSPAGQGCDLL
ncbi:hypothetical protein [Streptomyces sp. SBT349]|uniref:hypothetical protein n=1 Tax=Streptomyces sp. SBT349 TaxID=1580539 RepID=UPI00066C9109|nr:hypothetical protein [Streptomyces sp. SBT349]